MIKRIILVIIFGCINYLSFSGIQIYRTALLIGVSKYPKSTGWAQISCHNDIVHLNKALLESGFQQNKINILEDSLATRTGIVRALKNLALNAQSGAIIFIHFSGHGQQIEDDNDDEKDGFDECLVPYNARARYEIGIYEGENHIRDDELIKLLNDIRQKIGGTGQLIFSSDADHTGPDEDNNSEKLKDSEKVLGRGGIFDEFNSVELNLELCPVILMTASNNKHFNYETEDDSGNAIGSFSYALYKSLTENKYTDYKNFTDLFDTLKVKMYRFSPLQVPIIAGDVSEKVFISSDKKVVSKKEKLKANCFVISIGINSYKTNSKLQFTNSVSDAISFANFVKQSFQSRSGDSDILHKYLLTNENATGKDILDTLNKIITISKPSDYFIFNFAGRTSTFHDSLGAPVTYFYPSDLLNSDDSIEVKQKGISLNKLKNLLDLIPANNQLLITEAGATDNFQREFVKILIESSPAISSITKRNRIIIVPGSSGQDFFYCNGKKIEGGPLNYFITQLNVRYNIFDLFKSGNYRSNIERQILKNEMDCDFSRKIYTQFFFERKFIEDLQYFLPENMMKTRGSKVVNEDKKAFKKAINGKYALILGTNIYGGKPQWSDLANPEMDAKEIAEELKKTYGFETKLMLNPSQDSLYAALFHYSQTLDTNDQLIIFFAGHGDFDEKYFDDGFIVLNNSATTKNDPYRKTYLQHAELQRMINKLPPKQIMVIMDVCFGGTFDERVVKLAGRNKNDIYSDVDASAFVSAKLKYNTRIYITSGGKKEVPDGYKGKHSPFALKLLEALRTEGGNNGFLTASEIYAFVQRLPSGPLMGNFGDHEIGGEFMLVPKK